MSGLAAALERERVVVIAALALLIACAWVYVWFGAGMGMSALDMTTLALFPHLQTDAGGSMGFSWGVVIAMWWLMMVAMMTPSAVPLVLLYSRVLHVHAASGTDTDAYAGSSFVAAGYLAAWLLFSVAAAFLQSLLQPGLLSDSMLWSKSRMLSASLLALAGIYQLSPLKGACLKQCRAPAMFLVRNWKPGRLAALMLGFRHGVYCVGCCFLLMGLLFVGGVMNLVWIAALTLLVIAEKLLPRGATIGKVSGYALIAWEIATLAV